MQWGGGVVARQPGLRNTSGPFADTFSPQLHVQCSTGPCVMLILHLIFRVNQGWQAADLLLLSTNITLPNFASQKMFLFPPRFSQSHIKYQSFKHSSSDIDQGHSHTLGYYVRVQVYF